jgi:hypothetical protein
MYTYNTGYRPSQYIQFGVRKDLTTLDSVIFKNWPHRDNGNLVTIRVSQITVNGAAKTMPKDITSAMKRLVSDLRMAETVKPPLKWEFNSDTQVLSTEKIGLKGRVPLELQLTAQNYTFTAEGVAELKKAILHTGEAVEVADCGAPGKGEFYLTGNAVSPGAV